MTRSGLILDFGGVVTTDFYAALTAFSLREGLPANAVEHAVRETDEGRQALADVESGAITQRDYEITLGRLLGVSDNGLLGRVLADLQPCEPVLALVDQARAAGIRVGVLSNSWGSGDYDPYSGYNLDRRFDAVVISDHVGLRKPDPAIYMLCADKLGLPTTSCLFVDDTPHNLPPAQALGMDVIDFQDVATGIADIEAKLGLTTHSSQTPTP